MSGTAVVDVESIPRTRPTFFAVVRRIPATLALVVAILVVGVVFHGLWSPFEKSDLWDAVAYGLPALEAGRWWTPITGTFFVNQPWVYVFTISGFVGMAILEYMRGWRLALGYFWVGQLFAILASASFLWIVGHLEWWRWAQTEAAALDVGASGGTMACIAGAIGLFIVPWRQRAWLILLAFVLVAMLFWGNLADLEHLFAVLLILFVDRSLRFQRTSLHERRFIAWVSMAVLGAIELIALLAPTDGPFGPTDPGSGSVWDLAIDLVLILLVANGLRRGKLWAWVISIVLASFNLLTGLLIVLLVGLQGWTDVEVALDGDPSFTLATSALWTLMFAYLILARRAFRARRKLRIGAKPTPTVDDVKEMLRAHGGGTLSWMSTWDGNSYARTTAGIVAYQRRAGVAIALADPLGPAATRAQSTREFIEQAERAGLVPCFFSAGDATKDAVPEGWRSIVVADDTIMDLPGLQFTGKKWAAVRTAINRADREDVDFRLARLSELSWGMKQQLRAISESWVGDKGLPEMGFTLGTLREAEDPEVRIALAVAANGDIDGFLSWLPVYEGDGVVRGWTLDLMRRRDGGFGPVMEFLIGSSAKAFSAEGAKVLSLSGAPLAHDYPPDAGLIADLSAWIAQMLEPVYGFGSLHRFKEKFQPRYETMYLLYRDEGDLTRIGLGLTRAFLPDATLRQFAGAGLELVRGK